MKKYILITTVAGVFLGISALAATSITLSPTTVSVSAGQTFTTSVSVNPQGVKNSTVGLKLNYPADLLEVQSFPFDGQWMALSQPGYYLTDNTNGVLIRTAGYPKGFSSDTHFGTITFLAKKTGVGVVEVVSGTSAFDQANTNVFAGSSQVNVSVITPVATVTPTPSATVSESPAPSPSSEPSADLSLQQATILGGIGNVFGLGTGNWIVALVLILAIAYGAYWFVKRKFKK